MNNSKVCMAGFSRSAHSYDEYSIVQKRVAERLVELLPKNFIPKRIIDLGCGTGYLSRLVQNQYPHQELTICDISEEMLSVAHKKVAANLLNYDFEMLNETISGKYDLIISSSSLHWNNSFKNISTVLKRISCPNSLIAVSLMLNGTLNEIRSIRESLVPNKKIYPELRKLDYYINILNDNFTIIKTEEKIYTEYYSTAEEAMNSLRKTGVNTGNSEKLSRSEYLSLISEYTKTHKTSKGFPLSFKSGFIVCSNHL